jgi:type II secretory pathway pseudopilin PulG
MRNNRGFTLFDLMILVVLIGILAAIAIPNFMNIEATAVIRNNCHVLAEAVRNFALDNDGEYPRQEDDVNLHGKTVVDYLPDGKLLINPYTNLRSEPRTLPAVSQNETGYVWGAIYYTSLISRGQCTGYVILGWGKYGRLAKIKGP